MCGLIGGALPHNSVVEALATIHHRGPDASGAVTAGPWTLGHTRLAIQDLTAGSVQPYIVNDVVVTYNGEQWHPEHLRQLAALRTWATTGDTEIVAALLAEHGTTALSLLDGMFALAWTDGTCLYLARDTYGEVPLHYGQTATGRFVYASEIGPLITLGAIPASVRWVEPGHFVAVTNSGTVTKQRWAPVCDLRPLDDPLPCAAANLRQLLQRGVEGRLTADVPVAVLASGGLDSTAILSLIRHTAPHLPIVAYTAVHNPKSADVRNARIACEHAQVSLVEVLVPAPTADDLAAVVATIEMPHKAQVEIAYACQFLAAAIAGDGARVVLSGEGADEMFASYGSSFHGVRQYGWHQYRHATFVGQHRKNFARTNKVFMRHGIEARLPFLEPDLVRYVMRLPQSSVVDGKEPKAVLGRAVADLIPDVIRRRTKVAFQTGAKIDQSAAKAVADPPRFYKTEFARQFKGAPS